MGLLGFPNAGKSTFLSVVSAARPKIADYPFTTLIPQLGVVGLNEGESFVLADIPGLIEGAAEGAGLGIRFLKHLERVRVLCHLVEAPSELTPEDEPRIEDSRVLHRYLALRKELAEYSEELAELPEVVVLSKSDVAAGEDLLGDPEVAVLKAHLADENKPLLVMSAATGDGVDAVKYALWSYVQRDAAEDEGAEAQDQGYDPLG